LGVIPPTPVLFFDSHCGLCARCVTWLFRHDTKGLLCCFALESEIAHDFFQSLPHHEALPDSAIYAEDWNDKSGRTLRFRTDALIAAAVALGGFWQLFILLKIFPRGIRDAAYRFVARHRHRLFAEPTDELWRSRLDEVRRRSLGRIASSGNKPPIQRIAGPLDN
jgi:predicted DCC family thiol-disulfide oxidoreductase YuxK